MTRNSKTHTHARIHTRTHTHARTHKCAAGIDEIAEPDTSAAMYPAFYSRLPFQTANIQLCNYKAKYWENKIVTFVS